MLYNSFVYLLPFLGLTVALYYLIPLKDRWKVLLLSSILFFMIASGWLILLLLFSALTVYIGAIRIEKDLDSFKDIRTGMDRKERKEYKKAMTSRHRKWIGLIVFLNLLVLFLSKYLNFAIDNINRFLHLLHHDGTLQTLPLLMPLGISFYTLSAIGYVTDVARGSCKAEKNYGRLVLFLSFFPLITEGPIERYTGLGRQIQEEHAFDYTSFCYGLQLILWGLIQKVVLADRFNVIVHEVFTNYTTYSGLAVLTGIMIYTFQLYMDFSGCIDIARGSAELFGIHLSENFRRPFFSASVNEFWRRWHITLGSWLKDYVFYPVSLSPSFQRFSKYCRKKLPRYYAATLPGIFALFAVWISNGLWHGAEWKYVAYGMYYYMIMTASMLLEPAFALLSRKLSINRESRVYHCFQVGRTFILVNIGMLIFRADHLPAAFSMFRSLIVPYHFRDGYLAWLFDKGNIHLSEIVLLFASLVFLCLYGHYKEKGGCLRKAIASRPLPLRFGIYLTAVITIIVIGAYGPGFGVVDFIYARF